MRMEDFDREDMVRIGGVWVDGRDVPDAAELAQDREERRRESKAAELRPGDRTPDLPPW